MGRFQAIVTGEVQGVGYRAYARSTAMSLGLVCIARNLPDGSVEVLTEGESERLQEFERALGTGPPHARVDGVVVRRS